MCTNLHEFVYSYVWDQLTGVQAVLSGLIVIIFKGQDFCPGRMV